MSGTEVAVVGGGIAGTTIAYELARRGLRVTLFEQGTLAAGASGRNTGTLLHQAEPAVAAMLRASVASYGTLDAGFRWTPREELLLARTPSQLALARAKGAAIAAQGVRTSELDGDELRAAFPAFGPSVLGGVVLEGVCTVDAELATRAFAEAARAAGARIRTQVRVAAVEDGGLLTDEGRVAADAIVVATGPWLADLVACRVRAGRGWLLRTGRLDVPWIVEEVSWPDQAVLGRAAEPVPLGEVGETVVGECALICPLPDGTALLGASLSTSLRDAVEGTDVPRRMAERVLAVAPGLSAGVVRAWSGLRPMTPDGLPIAGPLEGPEPPPASERAGRAGELAAPASPGGHAAGAGELAAPASPGGRAAGAGELAAAASPGGRAAGAGELAAPASPGGRAVGAGRVWVHGGHGSLGMQAAPATAAWLAADMHGEATPDTYAQLAPGRFA